MYKLYGEDKKIRLGTKISLLTVISTVCIILFLGITLIFLFTFFFSRQVKEDIEYYILNINKQFNDNIRFIQDGVISIRHNTVMEEFFKQNHYDEEEVQKQLIYSMDLFSDQNISSQNSPFVMSVYLFNNRGSFVRKHYYPITLSNSEKTDIFYRNMELNYRSSDKQFKWYTDGDKADLCFSVFDNRMKKMGTCIVSIQMRGMESVFKDVMKYQNYTWIVFNEEMIISGSERMEDQKKLMEAPKNYLGDYQINEKYFICSTNSPGLGLETAVCVSKKNIYTVLQPMLLTFIFLLIVVLLLVTTIILTVSHRSIRPLKEMAEEISAFGKENLHVRMTDFSVKEFHDISFVFNEMADRIDHLITEVYEKELLATRSQVKFLQAQINPHFQFNILAMLSVKAKIAGNEELYRSLQAFSKLIQGKIFREKEIKIPLKSEMELVEFYLYLQKGRYQDKLSYEIKYESEEVKEYMIPRLLIEPLVENAVSHGLEPKSEAGKIWIDIFEKENKLHIIIKDDGVGFEEGKEQIKIKDGHTFTGLSNTRRLLEILYRGNYSLFIDGKVGKGTYVEVILPIERGENHVESHGS